MEELIERIENRCRLGEQEKELLRQTLRVLHLPKGSVVIGKGRINDSVYFISKGIWRAYIERDGEEYTLWFAIPGETVLSSWGYTRGLPSRLTISSSSDSIAIEMKRSTMGQLSESSPDFSAWLQELYVDMLLNTDNALVDLSNPKAEKRYLAFMKKMPEIFNYVPLKEVAGYIGITPQSLSRIRANLGKKTDKQLY